MTGTVTARLRNVSKSFGRGATLVQALRDIHLDIHAGELTLIEGPSGSGKTTLLHILGLLQRPDRGEVWIGGRRIDNLPESALPDERRGKIALIFQGYNLLEALTARDNVAVAGRLRGAAMARAEVSACLGQFGMSDRAEHQPSELSGGEKQRTAIARALAGGGGLVLADEPTANLDWENAQEVMAHLSALTREEGKAVVMVSHDSRLEPFADRMVGLLNGRICEDRRCGREQGTEGERHGGTKARRHGGAGEGTKGRRDEGTTEPSRDREGAGERHGGTKARRHGGAGEGTKGRRDEGTTEPSRDREGAGEWHGGTKPRRHEGQESMTPAEGADTPGGIGKRTPGHATQHGSPNVRVRRGAQWIGAFGVLVLLSLAAIVVIKYVLPAPPVAVERAGPAWDAPGTPYAAAAPAVVEPSTQLVAIRTERRGRIKAVLKRAGDRIQADEPLVLLDNVTAQALVGQRRADLLLAKANLAKLTAWDRPEERARAQAAVERAQARSDRAEQEFKRIQALFDRTAAPENELNDAVAEKRSAAAALEEARQVAAISEAGPIPEQVRVAEAKVEQAEAALRLAETEAGLLTIVSPLDGHVIYRHLEPGEVVDPESPVPILSVGNLDHVRLRAEVDEADITRVFEGQKVVATAEAFDDRTFPGRVAHLEPLMGRKSIRTERTTEQQDTKVREVLIELEDTGMDLPIDLQMTVRFLAPKRTTTGATAGDPP